LEMKIAYKGGKKFIAISGGRQIIIDLPVEQGGSDGPETFVAALASCMGVYVLNYCKNVKINTNNMLLSVQWEKASNPARISSIKVEVCLPRMLDKERQEALIKVAEHCLVHNTIHTPPQVEVSLVTGEEE